MSADGRARVLVVDDNPATLYSTSRVLRSADFEVTEAATGKEALELAAKGTDIVMLDVNLPDIHGFAPSASPPGCRAPIGTAASPPSSNPN